MTSQYRCDNCEHKGSDGQDVFDCDSKKIYHHIWCRKLMRWIILETVEIVGCASHSDFQSERENVLGEILKWLDGDWTFTKVKHYGKWIDQKSLDYNHVIGYIKSRRKGGEQG